MSWGSISSIDLLKRTLQAKGPTRIVEPHAPPPPDARPLTPSPLQAMLTTLEALAAAHGWSGDAAPTYNPRGDDAGLEAWLLRGKVLLYILITPDGTATRLQQRWLEQLRENGRAEVQLWGPQDVAAMTARLAAGDPD